MGVKRKDAAKKDTSAKSETLITGNGDAASDSTANAANPATETKVTRSASKDDAKAAAEAPAKGTAAEQASAEVARTAKAVKDAAKAAPAKAEAAAKAAAAKTKAAVQQRGPTDVALVLSVMNSVVLLALLSGLGSAAYLAKNGQLESVLASLTFPSLGGSGSQGLYALSARSIDGQQVPLSRFAGRLTIVTNVASEDHLRGYTAQNYARLNYLYQKYNARGLEILAFPSNNFGGLEPGTNEEIAAKVRNTYNATFPLFEKVDVTGPNAHPVWKFLLQNQPTDHGYPASLDWNFNKFVVGKGGWPLVRYPLTFDDEDLEGIEGWISANL